MDDLTLKRKLEDMVRYGYACLRQFPRAERLGLAADIKRSMFEAIRLTITTNKRYHKKTTLRGTDVAAVLKFEADGPTSLGSISGFRSSTSATPLLTFNRDDGSTAVYIKTGAADPAQISLTNDSDYNLGKWANITLNEARLIFDLGSANTGGLSFRANGSEFLSMTNGGNLVANGHTVWYSGNDGPGSGLDADKLDGYHATSFLLKDQVLGDAFVRLNSTYSGHVLRIENDSWQEATVRFRAKDPSARVVHSDIGVHADNTGTDKGYFFVKMPYSNSVGSGIKFSVDDAGVSSPGRLRAVTSSGILEMMVPARAWTPTCWTVCTPASSPRRRRLGLGFR